MPEIRVSPAAGEADEHRSLQIYNAVHPDDPVGPLDVREWRRQCRAAEVFLAEVDGELAGAAHVGVPSYADTPAGQAYVLTDHRGRGAGQALYATASRWASRQGATRLRTTIDEGDADSIAWAERRGFREVSRDRLVELDLSAHDAPPAEPPQGVEIVTWAQRPELARGLYEVAAEALPDIPGARHERVEPYEEWLSVHMQGEGDRPEGTFVALAGEEVVGYAKFSFGDARPDRLFHDLTAVRRAWRGRGIARALKHAQIAWAKQRGYRYLRTANEDRNEPIRRLNEQLGYRPIPGRIVFEVPISGRSPPPARGG